MVVFNFGVVEVVIYKKKIRDLDFYVRCLVKKKKNLDYLVRVLIFY